MSWGPQEDAATMRLFCREAIDTLEVQLDSVEALRDKLRDALEELVDAHASVAGVVYTSPRGDGANEQRRRIRDATDNARAVIAEAKEVDGDS